MVVVDMTVDTLNRILAKGFIIYIALSVVRIYLQPSPSLSPESSNPEYFLEDIPEHLTELFAIKELQLVALDPAIFDCVHWNRCGLAEVSGRLELGTTLANITEFGGIFMRHFGDRNWSFAATKSPNMVLTKTVYPLNYTKEVVVRLLVENPHVSYLIMWGDKDLDLVDIAVDKFEACEIEQTISVPCDMDRFELLWKNGQLLLCDYDLSVSLRDFSGRDFHHKMSEGRLLKEFADSLKESGQLPTLSFGTLLGWYRDCGMIPSQFWLELNVEAFQYNRSFVSSLRNSTGVRHFESNGKIAHGLEFQIEFAGMKDIFVQVYYNYPHNSTHDWTIFEGQEYYLPKMNGTCAADFLGQLFYVPCNYMDRIVSTYGAKWSEFSTTDEIPNEDAPPPKLISTLATKSVKKDEF